MLIKRGLFGFPELAGQVAECSGCDKPLKTENGISIFVIFPVESKSMQVYLVCYPCTLLRCEAHGNC